MLALDWIAEQRIREAVERGELDHLPGSGRPLDLSDDALVPEDMRVAYRILKNAGFAPPEVHHLREIADLEHWLDAATDSASRRKALARLSMLRAYLDMRSGSRSRLDDRSYTDRLIARFARAAEGDNGHGR